MAVYTDRLCMWRILTLQRIVDFIELKCDDFEPFMEDEEKFEHVRRCPSIRPS